MTCRIDGEKFPRLADLFMLARPYLERNDLGAGHTERVLEVAEGHFQIQPEIEELVLATIILHDIGGSSIEDQYRRGPSIAAELLRTFGYDDEFIEEVCNMIRTHHNRPEKPPEPFKILYDSDQLVKFSEAEFRYYDSQESFKWKSIIENLYYEDSKRLANEMYSVRIKMKKADER